MTFGLLHPQRCHIASVFEFRDQFLLSREGVEDEEQAPTLVLLFRL